MTATELLSEILLRCGEGYENYTERAKAAFNASVHEFIDNYKTRMDALTGLIYTGEYTIPDDDTVSIELQTLLNAAGYTTGIVRYMDYTSPEGSLEGYENAPLEYAAPNQEKAMKLSAKLAHTPSSVIYYKQLSVGADTDRCISLLNGVKLEKDGKLLFTAIGWDDTRINEGSQEMNLEFSPVALEGLITSSVNRLRKEIAS